MRTVNAYFEMVAVCLILVILGACLGLLMGGWVSHEGYGLILGGVVSLALIAWGTIKNPRWWLEENERAYQRNEEERAKRAQILLGIEPPRMRYPYFLVNLVLLLLLIGYSDRLALWFVYIGALVQTLKLYKCFRNLSTSTFRILALLGLTLLIVSFTESLRFAGIPLAKEIPSYASGFISFNLIWELSVLTQDWFAIKKMRRNAI